MYDCKDLLMNSADSGSEGSSDASDENDNQVCISGLVDKILLHSSVPRV